MLIQNQKNNFLQQQHRGIIIGIITLFVIVINPKQTKIFDQMTIETQTEAPPVAVFSGAKTTVFSGGKTNEILELLSHHG